MNFKKIILCATAMLTMASSCFAMESGYFYRIEDGKLYAVSVLHREGKLKGSDQMAHYEFIDLRNSFDENYSSILMKTGKNTYATTSGFVTNKETQQGLNVDGFLRGLRVGYDRMGTKEGDFTIEDLGNGKIKVSSNVGLVKGFGLDGIYQREETFIGATPGLALHALEAIGKKTGYLAIDDIEYKYRVLRKDNGSGYKIQAWQGETLAGEFEVRVELGVISFIWNNEPIELFRINYPPQEEAKG